VRTHIRILRLMCQHCHYAFQLRFQPEKTGCRVVGCVVTSASETFWRCAGWEYYSSWDGGSPRWTNQLVDAAMVRVL
jgi:hypothetical protein